MSEVSSHQSFEELPPLLRQGCRAQIGEYSLVLVSQNIPHRLLILDADRGLWAIEIDVKDLKIAERELELYSREEELRLREQNRKPDPVPLPEMSWGPFITLGFPLVFWALLSIFPQTVEMREWLRHDSAAILKGDFWRCIMPLFMHADLHHLASNMFSSYLLLSFLGRRVGFGQMAFWTLLTGILGNLFLALFYQKDHFSIGFSTCVFGILGLLAVSEVRTSFKLKIKRLNSLWSPFFGAIFLLVMMGYGEESDIAAHVFGFLSGLILGWFMKLQMPHERTILNEWIWGLSTWFAIIGLWIYLLS